MNKLATDEFAFRDAKEQIFQASFAQSNYDDYSRNSRFVILNKGSYEFSSRILTLPLHLYYSNFPGMDVSSIVLVASIPLDEPTARAWRAAFDEGTLRLRVWFRFRSVLKALPQDIAFEIDTIKVVRE